MSLRFIFGRSGTGKSSYCLESIRLELKKSSQGVPLIFLVPEQATFQMEMSLINTPDLLGYSRARVFSFKRLSQQVLLEVGGASRPNLSETGKMLVIRSILQKRFEQLRIFRNSVRRSGFIQELLDVLREFRSYRHNPSDLEKRLNNLQAKGQGETIVAQKLHDLALIYRDFQDFLKGRFADPDDHLTMAAQCLDKAMLVKGALVWIDGFAGFTPQELALIQSLMKISGKMEIALCLDGLEFSQHHGPSPMPENHLFAPLLETYDKLSEVAARSALPVLEPLILDKQETAPLRFRSFPALAHLERELFRKQGPPFLELPLGIKLIAAANRRTEVEKVAAGILDLCRQDGYRFRDIALILRDFEPYQELISAIFTDHGIPHFLDRKRSIAHHPLVELLRSALEVVMTNWAPEPVCRFFKTDFLKVSRDDIDRLENYVLEHGIRGSRWHDGHPWQYYRRYTLQSEPEDFSSDQISDLSMINTVREQATKELMIFHRKLSAAMNVKEISTALFELLQDLLVAERLKEWSQEAIESGDLDQAQEHHQVWSGVMDLLEQFVETLGEEAMEISQYALILESGLQGLKLGFIPPSLDQVLVGTIERSRHPEIRAAFILGFGERNFPKTTNEEIIINDSERESLAVAGLELGPTSQKRLLQEQFLAYIAITRPSSRLYLSYPLADDQGKALAPSPLLGAIRRILPELKIETAQLGNRVESIDDRGEALWFINRPSQLAAFLAQQLRLARFGISDLGLRIADLGSKSEIQNHKSQILSGQGVPLPQIPQSHQKKSLFSSILSIYQWAMTDEKIKRQMKGTLASLNYQNQGKPLSEELIRKLYGEELHASVSRLEQFAICPHGYFVRYGLNLKERPLFEFRELHLGILFHAVLRDLVEIIINSGQDWADMQEDHIRGILNKVVDGLVPKIQSEILLGSGRYRYMIGSIKRILAGLVRVMGEHARRGAFRPAGLEVTFGQTNKMLPPLIIKIDGDRKIYLEGQIDRIDTARTSQGELFVRIIDYKTSKKSFHLNEVIHGLSLQLLSYLLVVKENSPAYFKTQAEIAGGLYLPISPGLKKERLIEDDLEKKEKKRLQTYKTTGILLQNPEVIKMMDREAQGQSSDLIPARINKNGELSRSENLLSLEDFRKLLSYVKVKCRELAKRILQGEIAIGPYRINESAGCSFCEYGEVCRFDTLIEGNHYRTLPKLSHDEIWQIIEATVQREWGERSGG